MQVTQWGTQEARHEKKLNWDIGWARKRSRAIGSSVEFNIMHVNKGKRYPPFASHGTLLMPKRLTCNSLTALQMTTAELCYEYIKSCFLREEFWITEYTSLILWDMFLPRHQAWSWSKKICPQSKVEESSFKFNDGEIWDK